MGASQLRAAAEAVSAAWDAWMESEDDEGMDDVVDAIGELRKALRDLGAPKPPEAS